ncbi:MAG: HDIG domain-containing metalloprotein [Candidatus Sumerlaeia bacterium]
MANAPQPTLRLDEAGEVRRLGPQPLLRRWRARLTTIAWFLLIVFILSPFFREKPYPTTPGEIARANIVALKSVDIVDEEATKAALDDLDQHQKRIWQRDVKVEDRILQNLRLFFDTLGAQSGQMETIDDYNRLLKTLIDTHNISTNITTIQAFLAAPSTTGMTLSAIRRELTLIVEDMLFNHAIVSNLNGYQAQTGAGSLVLVMNAEDQKQVPKPDQVLGWRETGNPQDAERYLKNKLATTFPGEDRAGLRQASDELLMSILEPNIVYSDELTRQRYAVQREELVLHPKVKRFNKGDEVAAQGQPITKLQADALKVLEPQRYQLMARKLLGLSLMAAVFFAAIAVYLKRFRRELTLDASTITLHVLPPVVALVIGQLLLISHNDWLVRIWFPSALVGMLSSLLITPQVAFVLVLTTACLFGVAASLDLQFIIMALFGGFTAVLASRDIRSRIDILRVGIKVGLVNMVAMTIMALANPNWLATDGNMSMFMVLLSVFLNGLGCALATLILLLVFEWAFGIVTDLRLLELTGMKHPLIRQLEMKAPGTYQHTLNVAKLAEAAADAIGANTLLVRAGTYFHDVGKMVKPKYFSENQVTLDDKKAHARLSPYMSVLIIKNHVKEGMELARSFGVPQKILDFIPQHHGTGLIRYFYQEAIRRYENSETVDPVREEDFRYPGPKPQSIEAAIVLLADSVEAISASRFIGGQVNESELRRTVQLAIGEKFNDGQFDECNLTMSHLYRIREALVAALMARYHFRIAYPTPPPKSSGPGGPGPAPIPVAGPGGEK